MEIKLSASFDVWENLRRETKLSLDSCPKVIIFNIYNHIRKSPDYKANPGDLSPARFKTSERIEEIELLPLRVVSWPIVAVISSN